MYGVVTDMSTSPALKDRYESIPKRDFKTALVRHLPVRLQPDIGLAGILGGKVDIPGKVKKLQPKINNWIMIINNIKLRKKKWADICPDSK